jgi:hypothetical protein
MASPYNKAASPVVVGLLLVVLVVAGVIFGYVFLFGAQQGFNTNPTGITAIITPSLYSVEAKVGVLGAKANFTISLSNSLTSMQHAEIEIAGNGHVAQTLPFILLASQTTTLALTQVLNVTGVWSVKVTSRGITASSYYFQVVGTRDEAEFAVLQWHDQTFYRNLILTSFVIAWAALTISAASLARRPKITVR